MKPITVSITTRNRAAAVERCLRSLGSIADIVETVIVLDDASTPPVDRDALVRAATACGVPLEVIRADKQQGTAAARNRIAFLARTPYVLSLDDDAYLLGDAAVRRAYALLQNDPAVAAVAFAQADETGRRFPDPQQPAAVAVPSYVPTFIGFAVLIARDRLVAIGGYREAFEINGEEREVSLRWLDRGWRVVYLPDAAVAHVADPSNRDVPAYVRRVMRNDCLAAIYNEPLARAVVIIPFKFWCFIRMRATLPQGDPGGLRWLTRELLRAAPEAIRARRPVKWSTIREWRRTRTELGPYQPGSPK